MSNYYLSRMARAGGSLALALAGMLATLPVFAQDHGGAVYVLTNQPQNAVMVYARAGAGTLQFSRSFSTGGAGMGTGGDPLGSQGSLVLGRWGQLLFAVNAGSNDVSVFAVHGLDLKLIDREPSGGTFPVSVTVRGPLVYVLNAGGTPDIQGFVIDPFNGHLIPLAGSQRPVPGGTGSSPAQVLFSPDGDILMVTEKSTNKIDTWQLSDDGRPEHVTTTDSSGATPFGFAFTRRDVAVVSEAGPAALSSYDVDDDATLRLLTGTLSDAQKAPCWVVVTRNAGYAYITNTASGNISSYQLTREGFLTLLNEVAANTGSGSLPVDEALTGGSRFLYVREATQGKVDGFRIESDGSLTLVTSVPGVPAGAQGVAAR